ncbi:MAG: helix-turn-helix transcriptional regulator [Clostridia bacterium]|nr:helix-turn-helix transcriptional regulator [Clostridia bacterium]
MIDFRLMGTRIKLLRRDKNITQEQLAEKTGVSTEHISRIETGSFRPSIALIEKLSEALDVSEKLLLFGENESPFPKNSLASKIEALPLEKRKAIELIIDLIEN